LGFALAAVLAFAPPRALAAGDDAVRNGAPLNCPAELAYESCVAVLKANEAVKARRIIEFRPEQFKA